MPGTVVITGPNGGMTVLTARQYAEAHPEDHLVLLVRNPAKLPAEAVPASDKVLYEALDMTSLDAVRAVSASIAEKVKAGSLPRIKSLVCSAAIQVTSVDQPHITADGYEETFAVNHLAHFLLILNLLPSMAPDAQIIIVGSDSHRNDYKFFPKKTAYRPLEQLVHVTPGGEPVKDAKDNGLQRYGTSKMLQMMTGHELMKQLARRLKSHPAYSGINTVMFDPGSMGGTGLLRDQSPILQSLLGVAFNFPRFFNWLDPELQISLKADSAATLLRLMENREMARTEPLGPVKETGGAPYYSPSGKLSQSYGETNEVEKSSALWADSVRLLGIGKDLALM